MRKYTTPQPMTVEYFLTDHLGSTSITLDSNGAKVSEMRYKAWGEPRYTTPSKTLPTRNTFTGQYSYVSDDATDLGSSGFGLMFYNARWYDPALSRFTQADTIVPGGVQGMDRYAYVNNSPLKYVDPSGHIPKAEICQYLKICGKNAADVFLKKYGQDLFDLLWDTSVSWGAKLEWTENGRLQIAMLVLLTSDGKTYRGALWGIEGSFVGSSSPLSRLINADPNENGEAAVHISYKRKDVENVFDLPISNPEDRNNPNYGTTFFTTPQQYINLPEGTLALSIPSLIYWPLGVVDFVLSVYGMNPKTPYEYNQAFGPWVIYPVVYFTTPGQPIYHPALFRPGGQ